jgi:dTDP-4-amino-4,6-dideoxygalactose transaminase
LEKILSFRSDYEFWFYEREFEREFAKYCGKKFGVGVASGTAALQLALVAAGIKPGDEVITVPYTFIATALAISNVGAKPVFVDIDAKTYTIDVDKIEEAITERTKAILPVHLYGHPCNMDKIIKIAKEYGLKVIEDCAQAHGSEYKNKKIPVGDVGCFSFHTSKILGGLGNGGIVVTDDKEIKRKIEILKDPTANEELVRLSKRTPCELDAVQIVFLKAKLPFLKKWVEKRRKNAQIYSEELVGTSIKPPVEDKNVKHSYFRYVIRLNKRDKLQRFLFKNGVETRIEYSLPIHLTKTFRYLGYKNGDFPVAEKCSGEVLSLPISQFLEEEEIKKIIGLIKLFIK